MISWSLEPSIHNDLCGSLDDIADLIPGNVVVLFWISLAQRPLLIPFHLQFGPDLFHLLWKGEFIEGVGFDDPQPSQF